MATSKLFSDGRILQGAKRMKTTEQLILKMFMQTRLIMGKATFNYTLEPTNIQHSVFATDKDKQLYTFLKSKRIDVVMENEREIWILEVKEIVRPAAIGQLLVYRDMFLQRVRPVKPVHLGIVAGRDDQDVRIVASKYGIKVFVVNFDPQDHRFDALLNRFKR